MSLKERSVCCGSEWRRVSGEECCGASVDAGQMFLIDRFGEVKVRGLIRGVVVGLVLTGSARGQAVLPVQPTAPADTQSTPGTPATTAATPAATTSTPATTTTPAASGGTITGTVKAGAVPLPGVAVTATNTLTGKKYATTTDVNGAFAMAVPRNGRYVVKAELAAFATETKEVLINATGQNGGKPAQVAEFGLQLASRVQQQEERQAAATSAGVARGLQALSVTGDTLGSADASAGGGGAAGAQVPTLSGLGGGEAAASDSVTVNGAMGRRMVLRDSARTTFGSESRMRLLRRSDRAGRLAILRIQWRGCWVVWRGAEGLAGPVVAEGLGAAEVGVADVGAAVEEAGVLGVSIRRSRMERSSTRAETARSMLRTFR